MKVINVQLHKEKLLTMPEPERTLFLALGHQINEINAITKMLYWTSNAPVNIDAEDHGRFTILLFFIQLLAGKLFESWRLLETNFFNAQLSNKYEASLDEQAAQALKSLKIYFGKKNACEYIRNHFAFHYSPDQVVAVLPNVEEQLHLYLERDVIPNNLFFLSETLLWHALFSSLEQYVKKFSQEELIRELFDISVCFIQFADGVMLAIINTHGEELRSCEPEEINFNGLQDFRSINIPWFTDTSNTH